MSTHPSSSSSSPSPLSSSSSSYSSSSSSPSSLFIGFVIRWDDPRGFGFLKSTGRILSDGHSVPLDSEDENSQFSQIFCHHSEIKIKKSGWKSLSPGDEIEFSVVTDPLNGKWKASNVRPTGGKIKIPKDIERERKQNNHQGSAHSNNHNNNHNDPHGVRIYFPLSVISLPSVSLRGVSVAGKYSALNAFHPSNNSISLLLDVGNLFDGAIASTPFVLISHGHLDHCGAVVSHAHLRELTNLKGAEYFIPKHSLQHINELFIAAETLSCGILPRKLIGIPTPTLENPSPPPFSHPLGGGYSLHTFPTYHRVPSTGFYVREIKWTLKDEFKGLPSEEIVAAKREGKEIRQSSERIWLAYTGDTTVEFLQSEDLFHKADRMTIHCLVMEMTFLDSNHFEAKEKSSKSSVSSESSESAESEKKIENSADVEMSAPRESKKRKESHGEAKDANPSEKSLKPSLTSSPHPTCPSSTVLHQPSIPSNLKKGNESNGQIDWNPSPPPQSKGQWKPQGGEHGHYDGGHVVLEDFLDYYAKYPYVFDHVENIVLMHFSARYSKGEIKDKLNERLPEEIRKKCHAIVG